MRIANRWVALSAAVLLGLTACAPAVSTTPTATEPSESIVTPTEAVPKETPSEVPEETPSEVPEVTPSEVPEETEPASDPAAASPEPTTSVTPTPAAVAALLSPGDTGDKVRELQHRLLQLDWFEGKITDSYGDQTKLAVEGFQSKRGLTASGVVDEATWASLVGMSRVPTKDEMYNVLTAGPALIAPGASGDAVKNLQARLKQIAWFSDDVTGNYGPVTTAAVEGFQAKREIPVTGEVDQRTMDRLTVMTRKPTSDELNNVAPKPKSSNGGMRLDDRCLTGRVVCISKAQRKLAWVVDGEIRLTMDVRFGSELLPTRNGAFAVNWKSRHHVSTIYDSPMPYALFFSGGQAVHFSADFKAVGYNGSSHGCVNVRDEGAVSALFDATREGDKVIVYSD